MWMVSRQSEAYYAPLVHNLYIRMSRKNNSSSVGTGVIAGLIGVGAGLLGGYLLKKFADDKQPQKVRVQQSHHRPMEHDQSQRRPVRSANLNRSSTEEDSLQEQMLCPISMEVMREPMTIPQCGHSFEKQVITECLSKNPVCPLCRKETSVESLVPNFQLKNVIQHYQETRRPPK